MSGFTQDRKKRGRILRFVQGKGAGKGKRGRACDPAIRAGKRGRKRGRACDPAILILKINLASHKLLVLFINPNRFAIMARKKEFFSRINFIM